MTAADILKRIFLPWSHDSLLYEVTARCNLRCTHCYNVWKDDIDYPEAELDTENAIELIDRSIRHSRCRQFTITGGEPTMRDDLEQLVARAASLCDHVTLITNGTLLPEDRIKSLIDSGVSLFELPLNSADRRMHNHLAGGIDCFDKVTRAAVDIRYNGAELAFVFVGTALNIDHFKDALELGIALGSRGFLYNRYNAGGECHGRPEELMPSVEQVRNGLAIAEQYSAEYGIGVGASIAIPPCLIDPKDFPHVGFGFCAAGTDRAYYTIDPLGNVRPCNHTPTVLGNILETPLRQLVKSEKLSAFKKARPDFCAGCRLENECLGGCKAAAEVCYGSLTACEPFLELNRNIARKLT
ncbi:MAG: radical SAM protein [Sedimentisphaerales bacterium]|nr:radical SAM protein [Sedimentisphaerales bacterium]